MPEPGKFDAYQHAVRTTSRLLLFGLLAPIGFASQASSPGQFVAVVGVSAVLIGSALGLGGAIGFLFGIPRSLQDPSLAPAPPDQPATAGRVSVARYAGNTSLEQISDWLTKILVGVGLTQLTGVPNALAALGSYLGPALGGFGSSGTFGVLLALFYSIGGLFLTYLWTRLYMALLLAESDTAAHRFRAFAEDWASSRQTEQRALTRAVGSAIAAVTSRIGAPGAKPASDAELESLKSEALAAATEELERQQIVIDLSPIKPSLREPLRLPVDDTTTVAELLNLTYLSISDAVGPYTYGRGWVLEDPGSGTTFDKIGTTYARQHLNRESDDRRLSEVGLQPGSALTAIPIGK